MLWWSLRCGLLIAVLFGAAVFVVDKREFGAKGDAKAPARPAAAEKAKGDFGSELKIRSSSDGHYYADALVNNTPVRFLVDTGATTVLLSSADAARLGIRPATHEYTRQGHTANGTIKLAPVTLREFRVGSFSTYELDAVVSQAPVNVSLLGMGFLKRLESWEVRGNYLFLRW